MSTHDKYSELAMTEQELKRALKSLSTLRFNLARAAMCEVAGKHIADAQEAVARLIAQAGQARIAVLAAQAASPSGEGDAP